MSKWTPEPWTGYQTGILSGSKWVVWNNPDFSGVIMAKEDASRIVSCVNACTGIPRPESVSRMLGLIKRLDHCCNCDEGCVHDEARAVLKELGL